MSYYEKSSVFNWTAKLNSVKRKAKENMIESDYIPKPGDRFTMSTNTVTGDRLWTNVVHKCVNVNEGHVISEIPDRYGKEDTKEVVLQISEYNFYELTSTGIVEWETLDDE